MEVAGAVMGVVGAVGVLGQLLDGCLKGYRIFTTASNLGRDSERLVVKIRIEEMRLVIWGREWGVIEGQFDKTFAAGTVQEGLRGLAEMILTQLYQTVMDLNKLQDRYGLREETPGSVDKEAYKTNADATTLLTRRTNNKSESPGGVRLRARWVISDKEKSATFLEDLQFYNDKLEKLFPPARIGTIQRAWTNELLEGAQRDLTKLDLLEEASKRSYPGLSSMANLKQLQINLDAKEPSRKVLSSSELRLRRDQIAIEVEGNNGASRSRAKYNRPVPEMRGDSASETIDVFVEWTVYEPTMDIEERCQVFQRIDNLSRMLHSSSNKHPDLHTLDCLGYLDDSANNRYGMVYLIPSTPKGTIAINTLSTLVITTPIPDLDIRFKLAHTLAVALWSCHSLDWLHKTLCPQNILFFGHTKSGDVIEHSLSQPYLAGFDSSRPDHVEEMSMAPKNIQSEQLYRHPDSLGQHRKKYCKSFDIYSLGLVLLEIGMWKGLDVFHRGRTSKYTPAAFREKIKQGLVPALGSKTGSRYRDLVHRCLSYEEMEDGPFKGLSSHQMMESVLQSLETLVV